MSAWTATLAVALEDGRFDGALSRACASAWGYVAARTVVRRVDVPDGVRVVAVGGATLGGSGKTPLAIACAAEVAASGGRAALVGHAYRATPGRARVVDVGDCPRDVGDEALVAARALAASGARVVVAPTRSEAIALASRLADVVILDGVAQTTPARAVLALLAVDAVAPWGRVMAVAPRGDLRAPRDALLRACDGVVTIGDDLVDPDPATDNPAPAGLLAAGDAWTPGRAVGRWHARAVCPGVRVGGTLVPWGDVAGARVGLLCALARPERVVRALASRGVMPRCVLRAPDHGPPSATLLARAARARLDLGIELWLATPKCAIHFAGHGASDGVRDGARNGARDDSVRDRQHSDQRHDWRRDGPAGDDVHGSIGAPTGVIEYALALPRPLRDRLALLAVP